MTKYILLDYQIAVGYEINVSSCPVGRLSTARIKTILQYVIVNTWHTK